MEKKKKEKRRERLYLFCFQLFWEEQSSRHEEDEGKVGDQKWVEKVELQHRTQAPRLGIGHEKRVWGQGHGTRAL